MALSGKIERFCEEYVVDYNATQAAIRAGYKEKSAANQGSRLLKNDEVLARVHELQLSFNLTRCFDDKNRVLNELWEIAEKAMQKTPVMEWDSSKHAYVPSGEWAFDGKTATKALELIGKMSGMFEKDEKKKFGSGGIEINVTMAGDEE